MSATREFLSKVLPWERAGDSVFFNMHWRAPVLDPKPGRTHYWDGRAYSTLDELVNGVEFWAQSGNRDVYVCMSSQSRYETKTTKTNKAYKKAIRFQANVVALKSFYVDIDVKPEAYPTQQEALDAFKLFIEASDMPIPSAVVGSGSGGFHAHWVVDRSLPLSEWQPIANALAHACQTFGLICDTQCTIDSARILRVPGTKNYKSNPPTPVTLMSSGEICSFEDIKETLAPYVGVTPVGNSETATFPFERRRPTTEGSELGEGIETYDAPAIKLERVAEVCPFIADAICDGGANYNNPLWYMTLQVASFTEEGHEAAHLMSFQHPTYTEEETDNEYDRVARQHKEKDIGWPQCDKIKLSGATQCAACPLLSSHKSPLNFVTVEAPAAAAPVSSPMFSPGGTPTVDIWPDRYSRWPDGFIYMSSTNEAGAVTEQKICPYPIHGGWLQDNPWTIHFLALTSVGRVSEVSIAFEDLGGMGGARKVLGAQGMVMPAPAYKATEDFFMAWIQKLQKAKNSVLSSTPFGWTLNTDKSIEGFSYAGRVWGPNSDRPAAQSDKEMADIYSPQGLAQPWIDAAKVIIDQDRPALNAILAGSFAGPLVRMTGHEGFQIAGWSKSSGIGKSSALNVAAAVWGDSTRSKQGLDDTANMVFGKLGILKSIPVFWDEIQTEDQKIQFAKSQFRLSGGVDKGRMNKDLTIRKRFTWQTMTITTSNFTLIEAVTQQNGSHTAGLFRLFEFKIDKPLPNSKGQIENGVASRIIAKVRDHYGHAGLVYARFLGANHARVEKEVGELQVRLGAKYKATNEERYWVGALVTLIAGAGYANELGLTNINLTTLEDFLATSLEEMRATMKSSSADLANQLNVANILAQFVNSMSARHTLTTDRILVGAGKPRVGSVKILSDASKLDGVYVQIGRNDSLMRVSSTELVKWLNDRKLPKLAFVKALEAEFGARPVDGILGGGTAASVGFKERLLEIDLNDPKIQSCLG